MCILILLRFGLTDGSFQIQKQSILGLMFSFHTRKLKILIRRVVICIIILFHIAKDLSVGLKKMEKPFKLF